MGCISVQFEAMFPEKLDPAKPRDSIRPVPHIDVGKIRPGSHCCGHGNFSPRSSSSIA